MPKDELENLELTQSQFTNSIIRAQKQLEGRHFGIRKHLFDYDSVIDKQRHSIYKRRDHVLSVLHDIVHQTDTESEDITLVQTIIDMIAPTIQQFIIQQQSLNIDADKIFETLQKEFNLTVDREHIAKSDYTHIVGHISEHLISKLMEAKGLVGITHLTRILSQIYIGMIDKYRVNHIDDMQYLREKVGLMGYAQLDPLVIYKKESFAKYKSLNMLINQ